MAPPKRWPPFCCSQVSQGTRRLRPGSFGEGSGVEAAQGDAASGGSAEDGGEDGSHGASGSVVYGSDSGLAGGGRGHGCGAHAPQLSVEYAVAVQSGGDGGRRDSNGSGDDPVGLVLTAGEVELGIRHLKRGSANGSTGWTNAAIKRCCRD
jgi:hypothetical protein